MKLFICTLLIFFTSCSNHSFYVLEDGGKRPTEPDFKFKDQILPDNLYDIIDTNSVYIADFLGHDFDGGDLFVALRFFSKGRVYESFMHPSMDELTAQFNKPRSTGTVGFFTYKKDKIILESFIAGSYTISEYKIVPSGLEQHKVKTRGFGGRRYGAYGLFKKIKPMDLKGTANW